MEEDGFNFWFKYRTAVDKMLKDAEDEIEVGHTHAHKLSKHALKVIRWQSEVFLGGGAELAGENAT